MAGYTPWSGATSSVSNSSPDHPKSWVEPEFFIGCDDRNTLAQCLGNDLSIEGIAVVERQLKQLEGVVSGVGQNSDVQILKRLPQRAN